MAFRRIKSTVNNKYVQPLKLGTGRKLVITPNVDYNSILFTKKHRASLPSSYKLKIATKFNSNTFDGIYITSMLVKGVESYTSSDCVFEVYLVSDDGLWNESLITAVSGVVSGNRFIASIPTSSLVGIDLDGGATLAIKCSVQRQSNIFTNKIYANHLGIFESLFLLKQEVEFLDLTKLDE